MCSSPEFILGVLLLFPALGLGILSVLALVSRTCVSQVLGVLSLGFILLAAVNVPPTSVESWSYLCLYAAPGISGIVFNRARRAFPPGHCTSCGYDLTGNVSGKCSECGTATSIANGK